jgi:hypothetical protein
MTYTESGNVSSESNLYYVNHNNHIKLYDTVNGFIGNFEVWHDNLNQNKEYFTLNDRKFYIEDVQEQ